MRYCRIAVPGAVGLTCMLNTGGSAMLAKNLACLVLMTGSLCFGSRAALAQDADAKPHVPLEKTIGVVTPTGPVPSLFVVNSAGAKLDGTTLTMTGVSA